MTERTEISGYQPGPENPMWLVNREKALLLIGGRALLMQLAHPKIAQAIKDSGFLVKNPFQRLMDTAMGGVDLMFGSEEESQGVEDKINKSHQYVRGILKEAVGAHRQGESYSAQDQPLLAWVAATLIDSSMVGYEKFVGELSPEKKDQYVQNGKELFSRLGLESESLPSTHQELQLYINNMITSGQVRVGKLAKDLAPYALLSHRGAYKTVMTGVRAVTFATLPKELADQFGHKLKPWQKKLIAQASEALKKAVPYLPPKLRYFDRYVEADNRLKRN